MTTPQIFHVKGDLWLVPCMADHTRNKFHPLANPGGIMPKKGRKTMYFSKWSSTEDEILQKLVESKGLKHWKEIAKELNNICHAGKEKKRPAVCRHRWMTHLNPNVRKGDWTNEEDILILEYQKDNGNKWSRISKLLPGRSEAHIKCRWKSMINQGLKENPKGSKIIDILIAQKKEIGKENIFEEIKLENDDTYDFELWYSNAHLNNYL